MLVLGISAFYHDSAAAIVGDGEIIAAVQEERFSRQKGDAGFPTHSVNYCLQAADVQIADLDYVVYYEKPLLTFDRLLETYLAFAPRGFRSFFRALPVWAKEKLFLTQLIRDRLKEFSQEDFPLEKLVFSFHHHSHAASAFYPSPFERAGILVLDGVGEWATTSIGHGAGNSIELSKEIRFPSSLGLLYSAFTYYLGFAVNEGEYKVMGLAPYGSPTYVEAIITNLIDLKPDGSFRLNLEYFDYCTNLKMTTVKFDALFGGPPRLPSEPLTKRHMDIARSIQSVLEEAVLRLGRTVYQETKEKYLCLAGGAALNCVANGRLLREGPFEEIWVQPAAGDAGGALGAALAVSHGAGVRRRHLAKSRRDGMHGAFLGPQFTDAEICDFLTRAGAVYEVLDEQQVIEKTVDALTKQEVVGWFQGRLEYGPRALGNRSILADPRSQRMQRKVNLSIKYRESFRPFAPAILAEHLSEYFDLPTDSQYMLLVGQIRPSWHVSPPPDETDLIGLTKLGVRRTEFPAITHVDYSSRVQTVHEATNSRFHRLLRAFHSRTNCPMLLNTSFNVRDEPIVCSPEDAYRCFMGTEMGVLVMGTTILYKSDQWPVFH